MKISKLHLLTGSIIIVLALLEFIDLSENTRSNAQNTQEHRPELILQQWNQHYSADDTYDSLWGIKSSKDLEAEAKAAHKNAKMLKTTLDPVGKKFCVEKECYRLIGLYSSKNIPSVSFYNKTTKIKEYQRNQILSHDIMIKDINSSSVTLIEANTSRSWTLKLFDVNQSKYKPKDFNETY